MGLKIVNSEYIELLKTQIAEKDTEIRRLRAESVSAKMVQPQPQPVPVVTFKPAAVVEFPSAPLDWQGELNKMLQEEEDGVHGE